MSAPAFSREQLETALLSCLADRKALARELSKAKSILRDMRARFKADYECEEYRSPKVLVYERAERFIKKPSPIKARGESSPHKDER